MIVEQHHKPSTICMQNAETASHPSCKYIEHHGRVAQILGSMLVTINLMNAWVTGISFLYKINSS